jgi:hypothetical protein
MSYGKPLSDSRTSLRLRRLATERSLLCDARGWRARRHRGRLGKKNRVMNGILCMQFLEEQTGIDTAEAE